MIIFSILAFLAVLLIVLNVSHYRSRRRMTAEERAQADEEAYTDTRIW